MFRFDVRVFSVSLTFLAVTLCFACGAVAQVTGEISEKPIAVFYGKNLSQVRMARYAVDLCERMDFAASTRREIEEELKNDTFGLETNDRDYVSGFVMFLVSGSAIPEVETVSFESILDEEDSRRKMRLYGAADSWIRDKGNNCFHVGVTSTSTSPLKENADETAIVEERVVEAGYESSSAIETRDGQKVVEKTSESFFQYRIHDQILYQGDIPQFFSMPLPSSSELTERHGESSDMGFCAYLDTIQPGVRQVGWTMFSSALGLNLQQWDGETDTDFRLRRTSGSLALSIARSAFFDVDFADGSLRFATDDVPSVEGELRIRARNNSDLTGRLERARGESRFAAILNDNAAVTNHLCIRLPEEGSDALNAAADLVQQTAASAFSGDPSTITAAETVANTLAGMAEDRNLELLFKVGWTEQSDGVIYGGIQLHQTPELLPTILQMLQRHESSLWDFTSLPTLDANFAIDMIQDDESQMIRIVLPPQIVSAISENTGAKITHLYLSHENSCLWFAAGTEKAKEIIRLSVAKCQETGLIRTPFVSAKIDMEQWLAYPQDDPARIAQMPDWLDENSWLFPPNPYLWLVMDWTYHSDKPRPLMRRAFDLGGSQQFQMTIDADDSGLRLHMSLGEALANHMLARLIDLQTEPETELPADATASPSQP